MTYDFTGGTDGPSGHSIKSQRFLTFEGFPSFTDNNSYNRHFKAATKIQSFARRKLVYLAIRRDESDNDRYTTYYILHTYTC
jgi:hypothetical protein